MKGVRGETRDRNPEAGSVTAALRSAPSAVEVHVIFTTPQATRAALRAADAMMQFREARIHLLVPQVVPMGFPLDRPPVSVTFAEQRALGMARECCHNVAVQIQIVLCGNREECIERMLCPNSLVIIGSGKQRWMAPEQKLAKLLRASGHRVIHVLEQ